jgi:hypothetical protein
LLFIIGFNEQNIPNLLNLQSNIIPYPEKPRDWPDEVSATSIVSFAVQGAKSCRQSLKDEGKQKLLLSNPLSASGKEDFLFIAILKFYSLLERGTINDLSKQYYKGI